MNVHEFRVFARDAFRHNAVDVAVEKIVAQWESDVEDARSDGREDGWTAGQQQMYEAGARFD